MLLLNAGMPIALKREVLEIRFVGQKDRATRIRPDKM